jgi:hypothetical protein
MADINPNAVAMPPEPIPQHGGILSTLQGITEMADITSDTALDGETEITRLETKIPL